MKPTGELLDTRRTYTFYVDDALIDHFAPKIGVTGVAVYILLVRHAKHHRAFPSFTRISERLGISRRTVMRILPDLQAHGLITIEKRRSEHGDADTNLYIIQDLSYLRGSDTRKPPSDMRKLPSDTRKPQVVTPGNHGSDTRKPPLEGTSLKKRSYSLKESHLKEEEYLHLGSEDSAVVENSTPAAPHVAVEESASPAKLKKPPKAQPTPWPVEDLAFADWLTTQQILTLIAPPLDFDWWCDMSYVINGIPTTDWLEREYAKIQMYLREKPQKKPTPRGTSRFVRTWLEKAYNDDRRQRVPSPQTKEVHIHYDNGRRR